MRLAREVSVGRAEPRLARPRRPSGAVEASDMMRLRCDDCGTPFYSAAARTMAERGERCQVCGGRLRVDEPDERTSRIHVAAREDRDDDDER